MVGCGVHCDVRLDTVSGLTYCLLCFGGGNCLVQCLTQSKLASNLLCSPGWVSTMSLWPLSPECWDYRPVSPCCLILPIVYLAVLYGWQDFLLAHTLLPLTYYTRHIQYACHLFCKQLLPPPKKDLWKERCKDV